MVIGLHDGKEKDEITSSIDKDFRKDRGAALATADL